MESWRSAVQHDCQAREKPVSHAPSLAFPVPLLSWTGPNPSAPFSSCPCLLYF